MAEIVSGLNASAPAILQALINATLLGFLLTVAVWFVLRRAPKINAATRYGIWWVTLLVVVCLPLFGFETVVRDTRTAAPAASEWPARSSLPLRPETPGQDMALSQSFAQRGVSSNRATQHRRAGDMRAVPPVVTPATQPAPLPRDRSRQSVAVALSQAPAPVASDESECTRTFVSGAVESPPSAWYDGALASVKTAWVAGRQSVKSLLSSPITIPAGSMASVVLVALAAIALLCLGRLAWCYGHLVRLKRASQPLPAIRQEVLKQLFCNRKRARHVSLRHTDGIRVPTALGLFNPVILFPTELLGELTASEFENIVFHEYAHICRRDDWTNLLQRIFEAIFFFHPAVRLIGGQLCLQREIACDDWVVALTGRARSYAVCLTKLVSLSPWTGRYMPAPGMLRTKSQFARRIESLLNRRRNTTPRVSNVVVLVAAIVLFTLLFQIGRVPAVIAVFDPIADLCTGATPVALSPVPARHWVPSTVTVTPLACGEVEHACNLAIAGCAPATINVQVPQPAGFAYTVTTPAVVAVLDDAESATGSGGTNNAPGPSGGAPAIWTPSADAGLFQAQWLSGRDQSPNYRIQYVDGTSESVSYGQLLGLLSIGVTGDYVRSIRAAGLDDVTIADLAALRQQGVTGEYIEDLADAGMPDLTVEEYIKLRMNGIGADDVRDYRQSGISPLSVDDLISLRNSGVSGAYASSLWRSGFDDLSPSDAAMLRSNGVTADYLKEITSSGLSLRGLSDVISLRSNGVSSDFIKAVVDYGIGAASMNDIIGLRANGVTSNYLEDLQSAGITGIPPIDIAGLRANGIDPDYIVAVQAYGLDATEVHEIVALRHAGVTGDYLESLRSHNLFDDDLSVRDVIGLRSNGVSPEFIAKSRAIWQDDVDAQDIIGLRCNGVNEAYLDDIMALGLGDLSPLEVLELRVTGVDPDFAKTILGYNFSSRVDIDDVVALHANGVSEDYLEDLLALNMELSVDDVISLRSNGIDANFIEQFDDVDLRDATVDELIELRSLGLSPHSVSGRRSGRKSSH